MLKGREAIGYVVSIEGSKITLNLNDSHKGQIASHRSGVSLVTDINSLFGVDAGSKILILRVISLSFLEPREVHKGLMPKSTNENEPLRQLIASVTGWISKTHEKLIFNPDSLASPALGAEAFPLSNDEIRSIINPDMVSEGKVTIGMESRGGANVEVNIKDFLSRHVAVLGNTGQGKSCFTASIIQQLIKFPNSRIIVFDINGEYEDALIGHIEDNKVKKTIIGGNNGFKIPYYALGRHGLTRLLLPSEKTQRPALSFAIDHLQHVKWFGDGAGMNSDSTAILFDDCRPGNAQNAWNAIETMRRGQAQIVTTWPNMAAISCLVAESHSISLNKNSLYERNAFNYGNISPLVTRIRRYIDDPQFTNIIEINGGAPCTSDNTLNWHKEGENLVNKIFGKKEKEEWNIHLINLRNVAHDLMPMVLGSLLELFAFELFNRGQLESYPTLLVLEEAHHYLRQFVGDEEEMKQNLAYERIAKEGRKFNLGLWISTQRPAEVSSTVLSQCGTWIVFRLSSENDLNSVRVATEWIDKNEISRIAGLPRQQALIFGAAIPLPVRVVTPIAKPTPRSYDPKFDLWYKKEEEEWTSDE